MLKYLIIVIKCVPMIAYYYFRYFLKFSKHPERYQFEYRYNTLRKCIVKLFKRWHVDYQVEGLDKYLEYEGKAGIICNHLSNADPLTFIAISPKNCSFICKKEVFKFPVISRCVRLLEAISLDREHITKQIEAVNKAIDTAKNSPADLLVYIEGTRNKHPEGPVGEFHPGTLKIPYRAEVPIFPVVMYGTFRVFDKNIRLKKYPVFYKVLDPIYPSDYKDIRTTELAPKLQEMYDKEVNLMREKDKEYIKSLNLSKKKFDKVTKVDN